MSAPARILLVEDDASIVIGLRMNLEREGYLVELAEDGQLGLSRAQAGDFDLILLDVMLPKLNGYEVLSALRKRGEGPPVLLLSARSAEMDKVMGLDLGAEDYVEKPFSVAELLARVRVALRRAPARTLARRTASACWHMGEIEVDPERRRVKRAGEPVELTAKEFEVLELLKRVQGRVLSRQAIFEQIWGDAHHGTPRTIDNFISQLRGKLEADPTMPRYLVTVRGVGYRLELG
jgi:DNA-binding response OmpR family regulator